jgi:hypothetical protein
MSPKGQQTLNISVDSEGDHSGATVWLEGVLLPLFQGDAYSFAIIGVRRRSYDPVLQGCEG